MAGLLDPLKQWMTPERAAAMQGIGQGLSQLAYGQPVDMSPAYEALQQRRDAAQMRKVMDVPGIMERFTPEQQAVLASMPESLATKIIMEAAFAPPPPGPEPIKGVEINGQLVNPITGELIGDFRDPTATAAGQQAGYIVSGDAAANLGLNPAKAYNITSGPEGMKADEIGDAAAVAEPPETRTVANPDGSQAMVQWNPETKVWDPAPIPSGGTGAQPKTKLTEGQARITLFSSMQSETAPVLTQLEAQWDPSNIPDAAARALPIAGNFFQSPEGQIYTSASKAWAEGALRISTGSAGPASEIDRLVATYFAQPGDTPVTIEFKRSMREMYSRAIRKSLGETGVSGELVLPLDFAEMLGGVPKAPVSRDEALSILSGGK